MPFNIFSLILVGILIYQAARKKGSSYFVFVFRLTLLMYLSVNVGQFVKIGTTDFDYYRFLLYFLGLYATIYNLFNGIRRKIFFYFTMLLGVIFLGYIIGEVEQFKIVSHDGGGWDAYLFGINNEMVVSFGKKQLKILCDFFFTMMIYMYIKKKFNNQTWLDSCYTVAKWLRWIIIYGMVEVFVVYILQMDLISKINSFIFGTAASTYGGLVSRGDTGFMLHGLFREPSQYARALFLWCVLLFLVYVYSKRKSWLMWIGICVCLMVLSMSFTSVLMITMLSVFFLLYKCKDRYSIQKVAISTGAIIAVLFLFLGYWLMDSNGYYGMRLRYALLIFWNIFSTTDLTTLYSSLVGTVEDGSSITRIGSSFGNFMVNFPNDYLFGIGLGNSSAYSYTSNLIVDLGIIGTCLYMKIFVFWEHFSNYYRFVCVFFFICNVFTSITQMFGLDMIMLFFSFSYIYGRRHELYD